MFSSWNIFTGKSKVPSIFKIKEKKTETSLPVKKNQSPEQKAEEITQQEFQRQLQKMLPTETVPKLLNLISWSILAGILIIGGGQISGLGIKLIKKE